jgi:Fungal specific transcription factor domain
MTKPSPHFVDMERARKPQNLTMLEPKLTGKPCSIVPFASSIGPADCDVEPLKRQKRDVDQVHHRPDSTQAARQTRRSSNALSLTTNPILVLDKLHPSGLAAANWTIDPLQISPLTMEYLDLYFAHINHATFSMLPKGPFLRWVRECRNKTLDDKMILYTLMAIGCRFSTRKESISDGEILLQIARYSEQSSFGRFTLQLVQARLMMSLLIFSLGDSSGAWDYCGAALRAVYGLHYNSEDGVTDQARLDYCEYGLHGTVLAECKRRTFWSVYIMDVSDSVPLPFDLNPSYLADIPTAVQWLLLSPLIDVVQ